MAELNLNYEPAWLQQRPDSNQPMSLAEAFTLKQRQQQLDIEKALLPLRQQEMQARLANEALDHQIKQEKISTALGIQAASADIWGQIGQTQWDNPASVSQLYGKIAEKGGNVDPQALQLIEGSVRGAQIYSAKQAATDARLESVRETLATRQSISDAQLQAAKDRLDAAIIARNELAKTNNEAKAEREVMRQNRFLLNRGKEVTWDEFFNRSLGTYVRSTGKTPEEAAPALRKIYDDFISIPKGQAPATNPKDPLNLFPQ
jgi:hypothetical protein